MKLKATWNYTSRENNQVREARSHDFASKYAILFIPRFFCVRSPLYTQISDKIGLYIQFIFIKTTI